MARMRPVLVRFGESLWALIEDEANVDGVSAAHWIRDATLARALWERRRRGVEDGLDVLQTVRDQYRAEDEAFQKVVADVLKYGRDELEAVLEKVPADTAETIRRWYGA